MILFCENFVDREQSVSRQQKMPLHQLREAPVHVLHGEHTVFKPHALLLDSRTLHLPLEQHPLPGCNDG